MNVFKLGDTELEGSEAYLTTLGKNLSKDIKVKDIFCKNEVLNIC